MGVSINRGTPKSSLYRWIFHYKSSILWYPHLWKPPYIHISTRRFLHRTLFPGGPSLREPLRPGWHRSACGRLDRLCQAAATLPGTAGLGFLRLSFGRPSRGWAEGWWNGARWFSFWTTWKILESAIAVEHECETVLNGILGVGFCRCRGFCCACKRLCCRPVKQFAGLCASRSHHSHVASVELLRPEGC